MIFSYLFYLWYFFLFAVTIVKILEENPNQQIRKYKMKQFCVFLLFVTAVTGICRDEQTCAFCSSNRGRCDYDSTMQNQCKRTCGLCSGGKSLTTNHLDQAWWYSNWLCWSYSVALNLTIKFFFSFSVLENAIISRFMSSIIKLLETGHITQQLTHVPLIGLQRDSNPWPLR